LDTFVFSLEGKGDTLIMRRNATAFENSVMKKVSWKKYVCK
jgi:hypothetical protein